MDWKKLNKAIGPLRYQMSKADCVPVTIVNGLLVVLKKRLKPKLLHLIWSVSMDYSRDGTGFVSSQLLAHVLQSWFVHAVRDEYEERSLKLVSEIIEKEDVNLDPDNPISRCLEAGGVACLTTKNGSHYCLLIAKEGDEYLGFNPWWHGSHSTDEHAKEFGNFYGMINIKWTNKQLLRLLKNDSNKWVHLIYPSDLTGE